MATKKNDYNTQSEEDVSVGESSPIELPRYGEYHRKHFSSTDSCKLSLYPAIFKPYGD